MNAFEKLLSEKKYALIAIILVFTGFFLMSMGDSVILGILKVVVFLAATFLIFFFPLSASKKIPEPPDDDDYKQKLEEALAKRRDDPDAQELRKTKDKEFYIPKDSLPDNIREAAEIDFNQMVKNMFEISKSALVADAIGFYLVDPSKNQYVLKQSVEGEKVSLLDHVPFGNSLLDSVINNNRAILENDIPEQSNVINFHSDDDPNINSFLGGPIHYKDKAIGVVFADSATRENFNESDKTFITELAETVSNGIKNTDRLYQTASIARSFHIFEQLNQSLAASMTSKNIFDVITEHLIQYYSADRLVIGYVTGEDRLLIDRVVGPRDTVRDDDELTVTDGLVGMVIRQAKPLMIADVDSSGDTYTPRFHTNEPHGKPMSSFLCVPVMQLDKVSAIIAMESFRPGNYTEQDKNSLVALATNVALALARGQTLKRLEELSTQDESTGTWNSRGFMQRFQEEKARSKRFNQKLSIVKLDLDGFSHINSTYGQSAGETLLREFAQLIKDAIRTVDYLARMEADKFIIILPSTSRFGARILAERLRSSTAEKRFYIEGGIMQITLTGSIVEFPDMAEDDEDIIDKLDKTISHSKKDKGNRVMIYTKKIEFPSEPGNDDNIKAN